MTSFLLVAIGILINIVALHSQTPQESTFAVFDSSFAKTILHQCSRWTPTIDGSWNPSDSDIAALEANLEAISKLKVDSCCIIGASIKKPVNFFHQYVGIVVKGRKLIYVNAFPLTEFDDWPPEVRKPDWRKEPIAVCDGGEYYWGVEFEPVTKEFFNLACNGIG